MNSFGNVKLDKQALLTLAKIGVAISITSFTQAISSLRNGIRTEFWAAFQQQIFVCVQLPSNWICSERSAQHLTQILSGGSFRHVHEFRMFTA